MVSTQHRKSFVIQKNPGRCCTLLKYKYTLICQGKRQINLTFSPLGSTVWDIVVARFIAHYNGWVGPSSQYSYDNSLVPLHKEYLTFFDIHVKIYRLVGAWPKKLAG